MVDILIIGSGAEAMRDNDRSVSVTLNDLDIIARNLDSAVEYAKKLASISRTSMRMSVLADDKVVFFYDNHVVDNGVLFNIMECQLAWEGSPHRKIIDEYDSDYWDVAVATFEDLYWIRLSHRYLKNSPHFKKTREAIGRLSKYKILGYKPSWYDELEAYHYNYSHPALNVSKESFFKDDFYVYDHDSIHQAVAIGLTPAYQLFLTPGAEVQCSKELFDALPYNYRLRAVIEESLVLAIERSLVPHPGKLTLKQAYDKALEKVCTSITSGWFREFAYINYDLCDYDTMSNVIDKCYKNFEVALSSGKILPFKGKK